MEPGSPIQDHTIWAGSFPGNGMEGLSELQLSKEEGFLEEEGQTTIGSQKRWSAEQAGSQWPAQHTGILAVVTVVGIPADVRAE